MKGHTRRTLVRYAIALDLVVMAAGLTYVVTLNETLFFLPFVVAITIAAWIGGSETALAATGLAVVAAATRAGGEIDTTALSIFAACGALISVGLPPALNIRWNRFASVLAARRGAELARNPEEISGPLLFGLAALVVIVYANLSDVAIRALSTPSLLQPLIVLLGFAVWWLRRALRPSIVALQPLTLWLAAYCVLLFVSTIWAGDTAVADDRVTEAVKSLAIFVIAGSLAASWRTLRVALAAMTLTAALLASLTIVQVATGTSNDFGGLATFKEGNVYGDVSDARPSGPVGDPNFYAQMLLMAVPPALFLTLDEKQRWRRIAYGATVLIILAGTMLTYSRGAMLAAAIMTLFLLVALRVRIRHVAVAAVAAAVVFMTLPSNVTRRFATVEQILPGHAAEQDASISERKLFLASAWRMFEDHPFFGVGAGNFGTYFPQYANLVGSPSPQYMARGDTAFPHMLYLQIGSENGIVGLGVFGAAVVAAFLSIRQSRRNLAESHPERALIATTLALALLAYLITSVFLHGAFQRNFWLMLALVAAVAKLSTREIRAAEVTA